MKKFRCDQENLISSSNTEAFLDQAFVDPIKRPFQRILEIGFCTCAECNSRLGDRLLDFLQPLYDQLLEPCGRPRV